MKASIDWRGDLQFEGTSGSGHRVIMDGPEDKGGKNAGVRPMEMLLLGVGACSASDVVGILKKSRQAIVDCRVEVTAARVDAVPAVFESIHLHFIVSGSELDEKRVKRAVDLSADKYCSASIMLAKAGVTMTHDFEIVTV